MLIQLDKDLVVSSEKIQYAERCGNYVHVSLSNETIKQIWDEYGELWARILDACVFKR